jgi:hypothetical protein
MAAHTGPLVNGNTISVDTTAGGVELAGAKNFHRSVVIQNIDASAAIFVGGNSGLTAANGFRLAAGESISLDLHPLAVIHGISAGTVEARVLQLESVSSF